MNPRDRSFVGVKLEMFDVTLEPVSLSGPQKLVDHHPVKGAGQSKADPRQSANFAQLFFLVEVLEEASKALGSASSRVDHWSLSRPGLVRHVPQIHETTGWIMMPFILAAAAATTNFAVI